MTEGPQWSNDDLIHDLIHQAATEAEQLMDQPGFRVDYANKLTIGTATPLRNSRNTSAG